MTYVKEQSAEDPEAVLKRFDEAPNDQRVDLVPGLAAIRRTIQRIEPAYDGPLFSEVALLKIAYEFLACHLGERVYDDSPGLADLRAVLKGAAPARADVFTVDWLTTREYEPVHGLAFVDGGPPAIVKVYLFGWLVFRVNLHRIGVRGTRHAYMCRLDTGEEDVIEMEAGDVSPDIDSPEIGNEVM